MALNAEAFKWTPGKTQNGIPYVQAVTRTSVSNEDVPVKVYFHCDTRDDGMSHGTISLAITISESGKFKQFKFEDYEATSDGSLKQFSIQVVLIRKNKSAAPVKLDTNTAALDRTNPGNSPIEYSAFQVTNEKGKLKNLFKAIAAGADAIEFTIADTKNSKLKLFFSMPLEGIQPDFQNLMKGVK